MMTPIESVRTILASHKKELEQRFHVREIGVFGSFARGEQAEGSDIDILVSFAQPIGLAFVDLASHLEGLLGMRVHLVSEGALKPKIRQHITAETVYV
jgi:predicted nucleotidyltransferase